ncbi:hypothetical protein [Rhizobium phage RHph_X2_26]|nr:hypothetical protein [Rhizobium phage RHph_X2_26]
MRDNDDFQHVRRFNALSRRRPCEQCGQTIATGEPAMHRHGRKHGDVYRLYAHISCHDAAEAFNDAFGGSWPAFHREADELDRAWIAERWPGVADRLAA